MRRDYMKRGWFDRLKEDRQNIKSYPMKNNREISFSLGLQYLKDGAVNVVDVGCGLSGFALFVQQANPMAITYCFDGNSETVDKLKMLGHKAQIYKVPERLPFDDGMIEFVHCSHLIEHLQPNDLYSLLQEFTRILAVQGVLVVSTPTLWDGFYDDLSHVRPYPVSVLDKYLAYNYVQGSSSRKGIGQFHREALCYRHEKYPIFSLLGLRGDSWLMDIIVLGVKKLFTDIGLYRLVTTGYTAVYRKL